jgi:hypothetical protein
VVTGTPPAAARIFPLGVVMLVGIEIVAGLLGLGILLTLVNIAGYLECILDEVEIIRDSKKKYEVG